MASRIEVDHERGFVIVASGGLIQRGKAFSGTREARALASELNYRLLFDLSKAEVDLSLGDAYTLPRDQRAERKAPEEVAVVVGEPEPPEWMKFLELTAANAGVLVRVFSSRAEAEAALARAHEVSDGPLRREDKEVLVVDDDPDVLALSARVLRQAGFKVLEAGTGEEGLEVARRARPHLVLLDVVLPDLDGLEICRRMKSIPELREAVVALASGARTSLEDQRASLDSAPDAYIPRPVENDDLIAFVDLLLDRKTREGHRAG